MRIHSWSQNIWTKILFNWPMINILAQVILIMILCICIFPLISCGFHQSVHIVRGNMQISNVQNNHCFMWQTTKKPTVFSILLSCSCVSKTKNIKKQGEIKRIPTNKQWNFKGMGRMLKISINYTRIGNTFNSAPPILARQQKIIQTNRYN